MRIKGIIFDFGFTLFVFKDVSVEKYFNCYREGLNKSIEKLRKDKILKDESMIKQFIKLFNNKRSSYFKMSITTKKEFPTHTIFQEVMDILKLKKGNIEMSKELANIYHSFEEEEWIPFKKTRETLKLLSGLKKIKLAVLSNHPNHETIIKLLKKHDLIKYFDAIVTSAQFGKRKPDPDIFHYTLKKMGLTIPDSNSCLICGDEHADIAGGHKAGLQTILCERIFKFPFEREIEHQDYIKIKDISEIINYV